jgi:hypothetical protein
MAVASNFSRRCTNEMAVEVVRSDRVTETLTEACLYRQPHNISAPMSRIKPPRPLPFFEDIPFRGASPGCLTGSAAAEKPTGRGKEGAAEKDERSMQGRRGSATQRI